jgi:hypothetical protein
LRLLAGEDREGRRAAGGQLPRGLVVGAVDLVEDLENVKPLRRTLSCASTRPAWSILGRFDRR